MIHDPIIHKTKNKRKTKLGQGFTSLELKYREMEVVFGVRGGCGWWLVASGSS